MAFLEFGCNYFYDKNGSKIGGVLVISNSRLLKDIRNIDLELSKYTKNNIKIISKKKLEEKLYEIAKLSSKDSSDNIDEMIP